MLAAPMHCTPCALRTRCARSGPVGLAALGTEVGVREHRAEPEKLKEIFRILMVEDSLLLIITTQTMLDDLGWLVVGPATHKAKALALARSEMFDAALLDVDLDGEMSRDVATVLRKRNITSVFSTGYDVSSVLPDAFAGGRHS